MPESPGGRRCTPRPGAEFWHPLTGDQEWGISEIALNYVPFELRHSCRKWEAAGYRTIRSVNSSPDAAANPSRAWRQECRHGFSFLMRRQSSTKSALITRHSCHANPAVLPRAGPPSPSAPTHHNPYRRTRPAVPDARRHPHRSPCLSHIETRNLPASNESLTRS
jgi:hypothetical protein